ncbi:11796_t:CDS:2, partial [Scutellospora calospora]
VDDTFLSWELAEICLNQYAKSCRFSLCHKRVEYDAKRNVRRRTFECSFSSIAVPNKVIDPTQQYQQSSKQHNHPLLNNNMRAKQIYPLLVSKFSDQILLKQDLYNTIKKFRSPLNNHHSDAQNI